MLEGKGEKRHNHDVIMVENFPKLMKLVNTKLTPKHLIFKLQKIKEKRKLTEAKKEKQTNKPFYLWMKETKNYTDFFRNHESRKIVKTTLKS